MTTVNVATLKGKLSRYLKMVEEGEQVLVTSHRQPVARIVPPPTVVDRPKDPTRRVSDLRYLKGIRRRKSVSAVKELLYDRRRR